VNWKKKSFLVTGADGFIGSHLVERLLEEGAKIRAFVLYNSFNSWGWLDTFSKKKLKKIEIFPGDIRDYNDVLKAMNGVDIVFHLAALIGIPYSYRSQGCYVDTNVKGTLNILQAARNIKIEKLIHTSTSEVYGTAQYVPIDEKHPINPQSPYAATKASADHLVLSFYRSFDLPVTILRPFNTFGPRQSARAVIPTIIAQVLTGTSTIKLGNLDTTRDFSYVTNTVDAFIKIAEEENTEGNVYNCASGREISIRGLVHMIGKILQKKLKIVCDESRLRPKESEVMRLVGDFKKLYTICGWQPKTSLEKGIALTYNWLKSNFDKYKPHIYNI